MPKGRHLKPDFFTDKNVVSVSPLARLLYQGLWCYAADCGHLDDEPMEFKLRILPADNCDVEELLAELANRGRIARENGVITIPTLADHARVDKRYETLCEGCKDPEAVNGALLGNHIRWHLKRGVTSPGCEFCASGNGSDHVVSTTGNDPKPDARPSYRASSPVADGDGDGDGDVSPSGIGAASATRPAPKRATQRPADFRPAQAHIDLANELGIDLRAEWQQFCDHHDAKGSTFKDWPAALRTWIRNAAKFGRSRPAAGTSRQQADAEMFERQMQRAVERERQMGLRE